MITPASLQPGDLMFGPVGGLVPGVVPVGVGQVLLAGRKDRLTWRRWWNVRHAGVVVKASETFTGPAARGADGQYWTLTDDDPSYALIESLGGTVYRTGVITAPRLVQAMPSGAEEIDMRQDKHWTPGHVYFRPEYPERSYDNNEQGRRVAFHACGYVGTPYGFLTYAALAAKHLIPGRGGVIERAIDRRITDRGEMICSQLVDQALTDAGFHVFDDGRLPQDVVPSELFRRLITMPGTQYVVPELMDSWAEAGEYLHRDWR